MTNANFAAGAYKLRHFSRFICPFVVLRVKKYLIFRMGAYKRDSLLRFIRPLLRCMRAYALNCGLEGHINCENNSGLYAPRVKKLE